MSKDTHITFITSNPAKAEQLSYHLNYPIQHLSLDLTEIQSLDLREIVEEKVKEAYEIFQNPVLVEDVSLAFHALGKLPGPLIKWFLKELHTDGLCHLLDGYNDRSAHASVVFGLYNGTSLQLFQGEMEGTISDIPRGEKGFGWDPIFIPRGYMKTWGEMTMEEQKKTSMRRTALKKLESYLKQTE